MLIVPYQKLPPALMKRACFVSSVTMDFETQKCWDVRKHLVIFAVYRLSLTSTVCSLDAEYILIEICVVEAGVRKYLRSRH